MRSAFLYRHFKGFKIDFADSLLIAPHQQHACTLVLLIVESKVFHIRLHAVLARAGGFAEGHDAGKYRVFGIVFKVTTGESAAMDVHGRTVPAGDTQLLPLSADQFSAKFRQLLIPGGGDHDRAGEAGALQGGKVGMQA